MFAVFSSFFFLWLASAFALFATFAVVKGKWFTVPLWLLGNFVAASLSLQIYLSSIFPDDHGAHEEFVKGVVMALYLGGAFSTIVVAIYAFLLRKKLLQE